MRERGAQRQRGIARQGRAVIVLGIDPGTAALGYGILERRAVGFGRSTTASSSRAPIVACRTAQRRPHRGLGPDRAPPADDHRRRATVLLSNAQTAFAGRPGPWCRPPCGGPARRHGLRSDPERGQERGRGLWRRRQGAGRPDGRGGPWDAGASDAGRCRRRPGGSHLGCALGPIGNGHGYGAVGRAVLDRSAIAPMTTAGRPTSRP